MPTPHLDHRNEAKPEMKHDTKSRVAPRRTGWGMLKQFAKDAPARKPTPHEMMVWSNKLQRLPEPEMTRLGAAMQRQTQSARNCR